MSDRCVHTEHCCKKHGCKYGDQDCPVFTGKKHQSYPCELCDELLFENQFEQRIVRVGLGLIVVRDGKVLVGRRKGSHAAGLLSFPGGHLDWNESWESCALRELREECGENLKAKIRPFGDFRKEFFVTNDPMPLYDKHYVTIFMVADYVSGEPVNMEPHKCDGWSWASYDDLVTYDQQSLCADWIPMQYIEAFRHNIGI